MEIDNFQETVINSNSKYLQIIGFPGTGKTHVLASRVARLIKEGVPPERILALTFTNSACMSLVKSIARQLGPEQGSLAEKVQVHTYHSFCKKLVDLYPETVGLSKAWDLTDFLDMHNVLSYTIHNKSGLYRRGQKAQNSTEHRKLLTDLNTYDFDQALRYGEQIINENNLGIAHVIVDEFQDCTQMQWELIQAILRQNDGTSLCVAGDPNQEVFGFQDDHLEDSHLKMRETFPQTDVAYLRYNYRSMGSIIDTFQSIISQGEDTNTRLIPRLQDGKEPQLKIYDSPEKETAGILKLIQKLHDENGYRYDDIAILVRLNAEADHLTAFLIDHGIPARHDVGVRGFGLRKQTSVALTLMKWSAFNKDLYLLQLLKNKLHSFIAEEDFQKLLSRLDSNKAPLTETLISLNPKRYNHTFLTSFLPTVREELLDSETPADIKSVVERALHSWKREAGSRAKLTLTKLDKSAWNHFLESIDTYEKSFWTTQEIESPQIQRGTTLSGLLNHLFSRDRAASLREKDNKVSVSTIHSAKSSEWPVVIVPSGTDSRPTAYSPPFQKSNRNLQYVAASRAMKELYFTNSGAIRPGSRNSFLAIDSSTLRLEQPMKFLSATDALKQYPLAFSPIRLVRRISRVIKL